MLNIKMFMRHETPTTSATNYYQLEYINGDGDVCLFLVQILNNFHKIRNFLSFDDSFTCVHYNNTKKKKTKNCRSFSFIFLIEIWFNCFVAHKFYVFIYRKFVLFFFSFIF